MEYRTPSSPNHKGSSRAKPTPNSTSRTMEMAVEAKARPRACRCALVHCGKHHHAEIDPKAFHSVLRIVHALVCRTENADELPGKQLHDQQCRRPHNGLCRKQAGEQRLGPVISARADVEAHHRDTSRRQAHRDGNDDLEKLHDNAQHRHGDLGVLRLSEDGVKGAVFQRHVLDGRHGHDQ